MTLAPTKDYQNQDEELAALKHATTITYDRNVPIKPVGYRITKRRTVLSDTIKIPEQIHNHINREHGDINSMLLDEIVDAVNAIYKEQEVAHLRRSSIRRSITLYQLHQLLFNLVFNYKAEN